jgi:hypothetical protein
MSLSILRTCAAFYAAVQHISMLRRFDASVKGLELENHGAKDRCD